MRPNLLLVVLDTARADAFEPLAPAGSTPVMASLARRGTAQPFAIAPSNWTMPSHASMFTGLLPVPFGLRRGRWRQGEVWSGVRGLFDLHADRVLADVLRRDGYGTAAVSTNAWVAAGNGFGRGFDRFEEVRSPRGLAPASPLARLRWARAREDDGAAEAERVLARWVEEGPQRPFFWFVNLNECHSPYFPPRPYNDLSLPGRWRATGDVARYQTWVAVMRAAAGDLEVPAGALERMRHLYARSARLADDWLGRLLERLNDRGLLDDTLVVVTSDHGENLGEDGRLGHTFSLDQRLLHVPLVAAGPGAFAPRPVLGLDALPRLLAEAAGVERHPWGEPPGQVAVAQNDGFAQRPTERSVREARRTLSAKVLRMMYRPMAAATDGRFKLVRAGGDEKLHDLAEDPREAHDVADAQPEVLSRLRRALDGAAVQGPAPPTGDGDEDDPEILARLEALGYL